MPPCHPVTGTFSVKRPVGNHGTFRYYATSRVEAHQGDREETAENMPEMAQMQPWSLSRGVGELEETPPVEGQDERKRGWPQIRAEALRPDGFYMILPGIPPGLLGCLHSVSLDGHQMSQLGHLFSSEKMDPAVFFFLIYIYTIYYIYVHTHIYIYINLSFVCVENGSENMDWCEAPGRPCGPKTRPEKTSTDVDDDATFGPQGPARSARSKKIPCR